MSESQLDIILSRINNADPHDISPLEALIDALRPRRAKDAEAAINAVRALIHLLRQHRDWSLALRHYLMGFLGSRRQVHLYADTGIYKNEGLFTAAWRKIVSRFLPDARDPELLRDVFSLVFDRRNDYIWVRAVPENVWLELLEVLHLEPDSYPEERRHSTLEMLDAVQVLSYRISGIGLEPELVRNYPEIEAFESPFLTQNIAVRDYLESYMAWLRNRELPREDDSHIRVLLGQCTQIIAKIRKHAANEGVSISLTYLLERLWQCIARLETLLDLLEPAPEQVKLKRLLAFWSDLVQAENRKNSLRDLWSQNTNLIALQVTEHASRTGEHYVTNDRHEFWAMMRSAMGAGFIVGVMALLKLLAGKAKLAPAAEAFAFSMNYSFGFMLVHVLHFTIATKQPAMTASHIAASIHKRDELESLAQLIVKVFRSQFIAIIGNVATAFPMAYGIAWLWRWIYEVDAVKVEKAHHLLQDINPIDSLAIFYAAIAGVCLFLSGLISGYYDNKAIYNRIPQRLRQLKGLQRLLGKPRLERFSYYIENNLGALAGNFYFGVMLGSIPTVGFILGLPLDIRHITFSTANFAYALVALNHHISWQDALLSISGIAAIGMTNLLVSFGLALVVALKARRVSIRISRPLIWRVLKELFKHPSHFVWAPKEAPPAWADTTIKPAAEVKSV